MRHLLLPSIALAGVLSASGIGSLAAQPAADDPATHHPDAAPPAESQGDAPSTGMPQGMMGMMTPEMMQMMHRMMGQGGMPGMIGQGGMPGMMGQGGMSGMMGQGGMPGMMGQNMMDESDLLYGLTAEQQPELTSAQVRRWLEQRLTRHGNPRLELGEIVADDDSITAEIVTVDGSLVQKLAFNRYPGLVRQVAE